MKFFLSLLSTLLLFSGFSQVPSYVPNDGLIGWWSFTGNATDESGNGNNGTVNGATLTDDRFGNSNSAYYFNGNENIDFGSNNIFGLTDQDTLAVSFWIFTPVDGDYPFLYKFDNTDPSNSNYFIGQSAPPNDGFTIAGDGTNDVSTNINNTTIWYHIVVNFYGPSGTAEIYVNGNLVANTFLNFANLISNESLKLGGPKINNTFNDPNGAADDLGIWNRNLTSCEVSNLYTSSQLNLVPVAIGNTTCHDSNDGSINVNITGGASPYQVNWYYEDTNTPSLSSNLQITSLQPGDYIITVLDDIGCSLSDTITILANDSITIDSNVSDVSCPNASDGNIMISNIQNATSPVFFNWSPNGETTQSITNISGGNYSLTISDMNGCSNQFDFFVNEPQGVNAGNEVTICEGDSVILNATGFNNHIWSNGINNNTPFYPTSTQYYYVTADSSNCTSTDSVLVIVNEKSDTTLYITEVDSFSINNNTYYQSGIYTQTLQNEYGCDSIITINLSLNYTSILTQKSIDNFKVYPNPTQDYIYIKSLYEGTVQVKMMDLNGKEIQRQKANVHNIRISTDKIKPGIYIIECLLNNEIIRQKVVVF